jgi:hypothetical protein
MSGRLRRTIELALPMGLVLGLMIAIPLVPGAGWDWYNDFRPDARGVHREGFFVFPWELWVLVPLAQLPPRWDYTMLVILSVAGMWVAARTWRGTSLTMITPPVIWMLLAGQLDGLIALGMALAWQRARRADGLLTGACLILAGLKPQVSIGMAVLIWTMLPSWRERLRAFVLPTAAFVASLALWGWDWPLRWWRSVPPTLLHELHNITLWRWVGAAALLTWGVVAWRWRRSSNKAVLVLSATALSAPYFAVYSLSSLLLMPVHWAVYLLAWIPLSALWIGPPGYALSLLIPLAALLLPSEGQDLGC